MFRTADDGSGSAVNTRNSIQASNKEQQSYGISGSDVLTSEKISPSVKWSCILIISVRPTSQQFI
jgi:hypothetical protein